MAPQYTKGIMTFFGATLSNPNLSIYQLLVPRAVTPRFTATKNNAESSVLLHQCPSGAATIAKEK